MRISTMSGGTLDVTPEQIVKVEVSEDFNRFGAHAIVNQSYVTEREYARVDRENENILSIKAKG
jgi:hypothetical protein